MKFERETNLYQDQALARKFKSQDTEFEIIQGHINAMISESEIRELVNGGKTMYSAMNDIKIDVNGLSANLSTLSSTVNEDSGKIGTLETNYATYKAEVDKFVVDLGVTTQTANDAMSKATKAASDANGISITVTAIEKNLKDNYYDSTATDDKLATVANNASTAVDNVTNDLHTNYYTIAETNSMFTQTSEAITSTVSAKYTADNLIQSSELTTELGGTRKVSFYDNQIDFVTEDSKLCTRFKPNNDSTSTPYLIFLISDTMREKTRDIGVTITDPITITISAEIKITTPKTNNVYFTVPEYTTLDKIKKSHDGITISKQYYTTNTYDTVINVSELSGSGWQKVWVSLELKGNRTRDNIITCNFNINSATSGFVFLRHVKLEYGEYASAWTPAKEDVDVDGNEIVSRINQTATTVSIEASKINLNGYTTINGNFQIDENGKLTILSSDPNSNASIHINGDYILTRRKSDGYKGLKLVGKYLWSYAYDLDELRVGIIGPTVATQSNSRIFGIYAVRDIYDPDDPENVKPAWELGQCGGLSLGVTTLKYGKSYESQEFSATPYMRFNYLDNEAISIYQPIITATNFIDGTNTHRVSIGPANYGIYFSEKENKSASFSTMSIIKQTPNNVTRRFYLCDQYLAFQTRPNSTSDYTTQLSVWTGDEQTNGTLYAYNPSHTQRTRVRAAGVTIERWDTTNNEWLPCAELTRKYLRFYNDQSIDKTQYIDFRGYVLSGDNIAIAKYSNGKRTHQVVMSKVS